jgi:hypothetical protein
VHISNRHLDLEPVLAATAARFDLAAAIGIGRGGEPGATPAVWVVLSPDPEPVDALVAGDDWRPLTDRVVTWTDDYSSILSVLGGPQRSSPES